MKKALAILTVLFIFTSTFAFAGGGQNTVQHRGDNGQGNVHQKQVRVNK